MDDLLEIVNERENINGEYNEWAWDVEDDEGAEWAITKIALERAETQRYISVCETMLMRYRDKIEKASAELKSKTAFLENSLQKYFDTVERKRTKTQETYKLPAGTLRLKYRDVEYKRDDSILLNWALQNNSEYVVKKESVNWAELKKTLKIVDGKLLTADGEIVDGVELVERPPEFEVIA